MQIEINNIDLPDKLKNDISELLKRQNPDINDDLKQMWYLMDLVWDELGCDNKNIDSKKLLEYYNHPVWILNGLFVEHHDVSKRNRQAIVDWISRQKFKEVIDYGGGFGTLSRMISKENPLKMVSLYEPHPTELSKDKNKLHKNIRFIDKVDNGYDCLVCTDVLEHIPDPLAELNEMINAVKKDGYLIIANYFAPVIKCHLPSTFHFKYSFNLFAWIMGLKMIGEIDSKVAYIYQKRKPRWLNWNYIRLFEKISKIIYPIIETHASFIRALKSRFNIIL